MTKKILVGTILLFGAFSYGLWLHSTSTSFAVNFGDISQYIETPEVVVNNILPQKIAFVGDILLARNVERLQNKYGIDYVFAALPALSSTTLLVGNFESAIPKVHEPTPDMGFSFSTPTSSVASLYNYGFSYLSLANNHSYDKGTENFKYTQEVLTQHNVMPFGDQVVSSTTVTYAALEGHTVALVGVYAVHGMPDMEKLNRVISQADLQSDFQVAYVHWGTEYELTHSSFQESLAKKLVDFGIDAVIGHHPHVVQDIQQYKDALIFYSLGNFIFDQYFSNDVQEGLWLELSFENDTPQYQLKPVTARGSYSQTRFMSAYDSDRFLASLAKRSEESLREEILKGVIGGVSEPSIQ